MKAFFVLLLAAAFFPKPGYTDASTTTISGPWVELRTAPVFEATTQPLTKNWGPALPIGRPFVVEKVYGRWLYGSPEPIPRMKEKEFAKPGWVFSRMVLAPGDKDTLPSSLLQEAQGMLWHSREVWKKQAQEKGPIATLNFLESLTLSQGTMNAFRQQDEPAMVRTLPTFSPLLPVAQAEEKNPPLGLSGTDLSFLDQEFHVVQERKKTEEKYRVAKLLKPPPTPPLGQKTRTAILGRFLLQKYLELPPLTQEEVDGFIYMRATALRALEGCPKNVRDYWQNRRWNFFRVFRLKSRPEVRHPWLEFSLPGGYFALSGKALELAGNEAEMAFLLVRPLVRELRLKRKPITFQPKAWPKELDNLSEVQWAEMLKAQSTKESTNLDVADEIAVDIAATECISRAGYRPLGGLSYLRKLSLQKEEPWAKWYFEHSIGLEYRIERLLALVPESLAKGVFPEGKSTNPKRFSTASRYWNLLP